MKIIGWLLVAFGIFYGIYCAAMSAWGYIELSGVMEQALAEQGRNGSGAVKGAILLGAAEKGIVLRESNVVVNQANRVMVARVKWSFPAVRWQGDDVVEIPISLERSVAAP
jgi:hypothetical protein